MEPGRKLSGPRMIGRPRAGRVGRQLELHTVTLSIRGNSYRLKEKLKVGLVRSHDDDTSQPGGEI